MKNKNENYHPWYRFLARFVDIAIWKTLFLLLLILHAITTDTSFIIEAIWNDREIQIYYALLMWYLYTFVEAWLLSTWGTTPGKSMFQIKLRSKTGAKLDFKTALIRSHYVWLLGVGAGILYFVATPIAYFRLKKYGVTDWDRMLGLKVRVQKVSLWKVLLGVLVFWFS